MKRRMDPANASRLGFTEEEVAKMSPLERAKLNEEIKAREDDAAKAAELGVPVEQVTAKRLEKPAGYFEQDEVAGSTRF